MPSIDLTGVFYAHSSAVPLINDLTLRLDGGWTGVVGANGSGKTTLLRLLSRELRPDSGRVHHRPNDMTVHLCTQEVERLADDLVEFARSHERNARRLHGWLALEPSQLERWQTLSPGERKRWQIGAALALDHRPQAW